MNVCTKSRVNPSNSFWYFTLCCTWMRWKLPIDLTCKYTQWAWTGFALVLDWIHQSCIEIHVLDKHEITFYHLTVFWIPWERLLCYPSEYDPLTWAWSDHTSLWTVLQSIMGNVDYIHVQLWRELDSCIACWRCFVLICKWTLSNSCKEVKYVYTWRLGLWWCTRRKSSRSSFIWWMLWELVSVWSRCETLPSYVFCLCLTCYSGTYFDR